MQITIHSQKEFVWMRRAGRLAAETLDFLIPYIDVDVTTNDLNDLCHSFIVQSGGIPAPLHYNGFPKSICTSKNSVVCHGIPDDTPLKVGDILNIDITVILDGWYGDTSRMFWIGQPSSQAKLLCHATYNALLTACECIKPGNKLNEIGRVIEQYIKRFGYSIVRQYCGHGIGQVFHTSPNVMHFYDPSNNIIIREGMFFTIEPMINAGKHHTIISRDNWTVYTKDLSLSAQFEHTIGVTQDGIEIFTLSPKNLHYPPYN
ncbi:type I methionyl aminopeptidase [Wolbachia endosymbiont of Howardula sp.]|uniref:type I methionyl aminopeptidase n=1 Tax=Wolbachia endosymbiont of Howardula sp. TaxID=2916816 RepID=UPI00217D48BC|nr:type I methionyl aminopeptidase [Wolbachia endosymbiont of Howardula sp.]UWI82990.1 type I methionyl aminopeptidase [Wolbachia endosymbiont of Howardula sp.]